jgi:hypothetical protein
MTFPDIFPALKNGKKVFNPHIGTIQITSIPILKNPHKSDSISCIWSYSKDNITALTAENLLSDSWEILEK